MDQDSLVVDLPWSQSHDGSMFLHHEDLTDLIGRSIFVISARCSLDRKCMKCMY